MSQRFAVTGLALTRNPKLETRDLFVWGGGEAGIRTRGRVSPAHALQACQLNRSCTSPQQNRVQGLGYRVRTGPRRYALHSKPYTLNPIPWSFQWRRGGDSKPR